MTADTWFQAWRNTTANAIPAVDLAWRTNWALLDLWTANQLDAHELRLRTENRLQHLIKYALHHSPFYARRWHNASLERLKTLPPVSKAELMANFDDWACDRRITREAVARFVRDPTHLGQPFLGSYAVWTSSGTIAEPGLFVQDDNALAIYDALQLARFRGLDLPSKVALHPFARERTALVAATGGHFAGVATTARLRARYPWMAGQLQAFSLLQPVSALVAALNDFQPTHVATYPTAGLMLADEQQAGRLKIYPQEIWTGGEQLSADIRDALRNTFDCAVRNDYGASEAMSLAYECHHGQLHLHADWMILEPVDKQFRPVAPGETSHTVLLTNLANRVQPLVRYNLNDSISLPTEPCTCGSMLPVLRVHGRCDDILHLRNADGADIKLPPLAIETVLEEHAGITRFQVLQTSPTCLQIRLQDAAAWPACARSLKMFLAQQGVQRVEIRHDSQAPQPDARSGKLRRVLYQVKPRMSARVPTLPSLE